MNPVDLAFTLGVPVTSIRPITCDREADMSMLQRPDAVTLRCYGCPRLPPGGGSRFLGGRTARKTPGKPLGERFMPKRSKTLPRAASAPAKPLGRQPRPGV